MVFFIFAVLYGIIYMYNYERSRTLKYYLAIDIGASSGRHIVGWKDGGEICTKEVFRFPNSVKKENGRLVWDVESLYKNIIEGIKAAFLSYPKIESLSVDTWGVDYVLLENDREILPVYAYRDGESETVIPSVHETIPFSELYRATGCQFQPFNTVYKLYCEKLSGRLDNATDILMMPEYFMWKLCGVKAREYTNATTTGMVNAVTGEFDEEIIAKLGYPPRLFPKLSQPRRVLGDLLPDVARTVGGSCKVVLCATHDTASAVEGIPMEGNYPYVSSGTWSLLGVKTEKPITDAKSEKANYSNEGGVGYNRYQKNIMGMWLINELQRELCPQTPFGEIVEMARKSKCEAVVDANSSEFLSPESMKEAFDKATGGFSEAGDYFRCAYRSLALCYKQAIDELQDNTGKTYDKLYIVGGGAKNEFLNRLTEEATGMRIAALPIEATALGNLKNQMEAD